MGQFRISRCLASQTKERKAPVWTLHDTGACLLEAQVCCLRFPRRDFQPQVWKRRTVGFEHLCVVARLVSAVRSGATKESGPAGGQAPSARALGRVRLGCGLGS